MPPDKNIYLIGFMAAGKTTVGKILAGEMQRPFWDTDDVVEAMCRQSIPEIFQQHGESRFRELETAALRQVAQKQPAVVALGGGAVMHPVNRALIRNSGISIYLKWPLPVLLSRLNLNGSRPLVTDSGLEKKEQHLRALYNNRVALYEMADYIVENEKGEAPDRVVERLMKYFQNE
ncbi:MAG: shikimate kinase [bacterium]